MIGLADKTGEQITSKLHIVYGRRNRNITKREFHATLMAIERYVKELNMVLKRQQIMRAKIIMNDWEYSEEDQVQVGSEWAERRMHHSVIQNSWRVRLYFSRSAGLTVFRDSRRRLNRDTIFLLRSKYAPHEGDSEVYARRS